MNHTLLHGIITPLATPFFNNEEIDWPALRRIVDHVVQGGVHAVFALGTTGEFVSLVEAERRLIMERTVEYVAGRVPMWIGVSSCASRISAREAQWASKAGANGVVLLQPYYYPLSDEEIETHVRRVLDACELPLLLYQNPHVGRAQTISPAVLERLRQIDRVVGIKDSAGKLDEFKQTVERFAGDDFAVFQGSEELLVDSLAVGAAGGICSLSNILPSFFVELYQKCASVAPTDRDAWRTAAQRAHQIYFTGPSLLASVKAAMALKGLCEPWVRSPLATMDLSQDNGLRELLTTSM